MSKCWPIFNVLATGVVKNMVKLPILIDTNVGGLTTFLKDIKLIGLVISKKFRRCLSKPRSTPISIWPTLIFKR